MTSKEELERELKELIVSSLALEDISPSEIDSKSALFGEGLGLDSIDALELVMALQRKYGFKASEAPGFNRDCFASVDALANFVSARLESV
ncbi:MAG TPA: phosphopantetheine-binding protein [Planctomycetota bacterium]|nr:phosphopantetheine-binding protein [Planctomycetota bacterium]